MNETQQALDHLARLASHPAVAFHESGVAATVRQILNETGIQHTTDPFGNILARLPGAAANDEPSGIPPLAIVAHLDHPGFELTAPNGNNEFIADALGGVPPSSFTPGIPIQVLLPGNQRTPAITAGPYGEEPQRQTLIRLTAAAPSTQLPLPAAAVFDLPDYELDGQYIRMRAADDLAGCAAALSVLARLSRSQQPPQGDIYALFTRAEEVGLIGARLAAEARLLPPDTLIISVESSRTLPGAEQGRGPVIRVGDAASTFNADAESVLTRARETLQEQQPDFQAQRQLMSGGVCEASAFAAHGYRATGLAFPLGNYHNAAPQDRIEAEYIHINDYLNGITLMQEAARRVSDRANTAFRRRLHSTPENMRLRLQQPPP